jgi:fatty-acyl-CoA synthase
MDDRGIGSWIERRARSSPDRIALVHGATRCSYAELAERIARLAVGLHGLGVRRGDRVVWRGPNHPAFLETFFAAATLGAAIAPVNHRLGATQAAALVSRYEPAGIVEHDVEPLLPAGGVPFRLAVGGGGHDGTDYEALVLASADGRIDGRHEDRHEGPIGPDALCLLPHTSGTTGPPRGVMLTHGNVLANVVNLLSIADFRGDDVTVAIAPFFRTGGTGVNVLPVLFKGGTVVVPVSPDPDEVLRLVEAERVTIGFGNPDLLQALTASERWSTADLSRVRWFMTGGAPVPERLVRAYLDRGVPCLQGYGLSEAAPVVLLLDPARAVEKGGSAGTPPLFVDVRVVRPDGTDCGVDETGELLVQGPNVMAGYWRDPDATARVLDDDGWLRTGDAARIDVDGDIWIVDRVRDVYESAGALVYPGDVERALLEHPAVRDAGVSTGTAFVVLAPGSTIGPDDLVAFCRERLAPPQVPRAVVVVDHLPRSSVGKLLRHELRPDPAG